MHTLPVVLSGAYNITRESLRRSQQAEQKVDDAMDTVADSERVRQGVDDLLNRGQQEFDRKYQDNEDSIAQIKGGVFDLNDKIVDLNEVVSVNIFFKNTVNVELFLFFSIQRDL